GAITAGNPLEIRVPTLAPTNYNRPLYRPRIPIPVERCPAMSLRFLRKSEVLNKLGIKRSALSELIKDDKFPPGVPIIPNGRTQGWIEDEVDAYIAERRKLAHKEQGKFPERKDGKPYKRRKAKAKR